MWLQSSIIGFISVRTLEGQRVQKPNSSFLKIYHVIGRDPGLYLGSGRKVSSTTNPKLTDANPGQGSRFGK